MSRHAEGFFFPMKKTVIALTCATAASLFAACGGIEFEELGTLEGSQCEVLDPGIVAPASNLPSVASAELLDEARQGPQRWIVYFGEATSEAAVDEEIGITTQAMRRDDQLEVDPAGLDLLERRGARVARRFPAHNAVAAVMDDATVEELRTEPLVQRIERDPKRYLRAQPQQVPWGLELVNAPSAWSISDQPLHGAKTCIIDSGVSASHEDLQSGALTGYPEGWNEDRCGHGTHVAGTIAALDNGVGVVGVAPMGADLFAVKVFGDDCNWSYASELADAVDRCVASGAQVVNMSLGGYAPSALERDAFDRAWRAGLVLVAAAGNAGGTELEYPASYPSVISVGAVDGNGEVAEFSQRNAQVDVVAPGVRIPSTVPFISRHDVVVGELTFSGTPLENAASTSGAQGVLTDGGGCAAAGAWTGQVVLCRRGGNTFEEKVKLAQQGGATAAIIYNNEAGPFLGTLGEGTSSLPAIAISGEDGAALRARAGATATVINEPKQPGSGYAAFSGTSMAAPHVAGIASLIWGQVPDRSNAQVRAALELSAVDGGPAGRDDRYGVGRVDAQRALEALRNGGAGPGTPLPGFFTLCEGTRCEFHDASVDLDGEIIGREFQFGIDGVNSKLTRDGEHTFDAPGPHTVSLTVTDDSGQTASHSAVVSAIVGKVQGHGLNAEGQREVSLQWQGAAGDRVLIVRNDQPVGFLDNAGAASDAIDPNKKTTYRVCSAGLESCSEELVVLPVCG